MLIASIASDVVVIAGKVAWWAIKVIAATAMEFLVLGGIFLLFGFLLYWLEKRTFSTLSTAFGFKAVVYTTGWIGTTAHELGHVVLCLAFGHRITDMSLFSPEDDSGVLGYVNHSYETENLYHQSGRLFIGIAPLLTGGAILIGLLYLFFPDYRMTIFNPGQDYGVADFAKAIGFPVWDTLKVIFSPHSFITWEFWVFLYVAVCISSHLAPSRKDMEGFWEGLGVVFVLLLPINGLAIALEWDFIADIIGLFRYVGVVAGFFAIALALSLVSFILSYVVAAPWWWKKHREVLNPF